MRVCWFCLSANILFASVSYVQAVLPTDSGTEKVIDCESFQDLTPVLAPSFIQEYGEQKLGAISYETLLFSPSGRFLAVSISGLTCGDPEQVWIVDLLNHRAQRAVEKIVAKKVGLNIEDMFWLSDDTLLVYTYRIDWEQQNYNHAIRFHSTIDGYTSEDIEHFPRVTRDKIQSPGRLYELSFPTRAKAVLFDVKTQRTASCAFKDGDLIDLSQVSWSFHEKYFMFTLNHGHGDLSLYLGITSPRFKIIQLQRGCWELEGSAFSPVSQQIAFPETHTIVVLGLQDQKVKVRIRTGGWPSKIAWSTRNELAFNSLNCQRPIEQWEKKNGPYPWGTKRLYVVKLQ